MGAQGVATLDLGILDVAETIERAVPLERLLILAAELELANKLLPADDAWLRIRRLIDPNRVPGAVRQHGDDRGRRRGSGRKDAAAQHGIEKRALPVLELANHNDLEETLLQICRPHLEQRDVVHHAQAGALGSLPDQPGDLTHGRGSLDCSGMGRFVTGRHTG